MRIVYLLVLVLVLSIMSRTTTAETLPLAEVVNTQTFTVSDDKLHELIAEKKVAIIQKEEEAFTKEKIRLEKEYYEKRRQDEKQTRDEAAQREYIAWRINYPQAAKEQDRIEANKREQNRLDEDARAKRARLQAESDANIRLQLADVNERETILFYRTVGTALTGGGVALLLFSYL
jgi:hypothetical protein